MKRRLAVLLALPLVVSGCSQVEEAASGIASDAASEVSNAATQEINAQICGLLEDGQVSAQDQGLLSGLVGSAEAAGVPSEIIDPLERIADAGDEVPAESVATLRDSTCEPTATPTPSS